MKRLLTVLALFVAMTASSWAAEEIILKQDFSNGLGDWTSIDVDQKPLENSNANFLGFCKSVTGIVDNKLGWGIFTTQTGEKYAISISWFNPVGAADDWLISPEIDIKDGTMLLFESGNFDQQALDNIEVYISTTGDKIEDFKKVVFSAKPDGAGLSKKNIDLAAAGFKNQKIRIGFRHTGDDKFVIALDNVQLINVPAADRKPMVKMVAAVTVPYVKPKEEITQTIFRVSNSGFVELTGFDVTLSGAGLAPIVSSVKNVKLGYGVAQNINFTLPFSFTDAGLKNLTLTISNINGTNVANGLPATDLATEFNTFVWDKTNTTAHKALFEGFTASTCPPCKTVNAALTPLLESNKDDITIIKYQMNFPGNGDPYYNADGGIRQQYYGVNAVPSGYLNGSKLTYDGNTLSEAGFSAKISEEQPGFVAIDKPIVSIDKAARTVKVTADIKNYTPDFNGDNTKIRIALVEFKTTKNKATNGETEFHFVEQHMIPNANGVALTSTSNEDIQKLDINFKIPATSKIENIDNLGLVIFVQNDANRYISQSAWASKSGSETSVENDNSGNGIAGVYPNPTTDIINIKYNVIGTQNVSVELINTKGQIVRTLDLGTKSDNTFTNSIDVKSLESGNYIMNIRIGAYSYANSVSIVR